MSRDHGNISSEIVPSEGNGGKDKGLRWECAWVFEDEPGGQCGCRGEVSGRIMTLKSWALGSFWTRYFLRRPIFQHLYNPE